MDWFARRLLDWYDRHGRKDLPWQKDRDPYRIWVSEIMLQQTQVTTVMPFYQRFMARFPDLEALAGAALDEVLHHWSGLGYYARARNLHRTASILVNDHAGRFPEEPAALEAMPGIGRSTAGAIVASAFGRRAAILDGNVKRVLARFHAIEGYPGESAVGRTLWSLAEAHTPTERLADYTQAIMDLGATLCTRSRPDCSACPMIKRCAGHASGTPTRFPTPRPRKALPTRAVRLFVLLDQSARLLLEQRPPRGIWGGLWTPPERPPGTRPEAVCRELGIDPASIRHTAVGAAFRHGFTHFRLDIEPVQIHLRGSHVGISDRPDRAWFDLDIPQTIGLSAPAAKLIDQLRATAREATARTEQEPGT